MSNGKLEKINGRCKATILPKDRYLVFEDCGYNPPLREVMSITPDSAKCIIEVLKDYLESVDDG